MLFLYSVNHDKYTSELYDNNLLRLHKEESLYNISRREDDELQLCTLAIDIESIINVCHTVCQCRNTAIEKQLM